MPQLQNENSERESMFTLCCQADIVREKFMRTATMIIGMPRQGKSTFFNWLMGHKLIGCQNGTKRFYRLVNPDPHITANINQGLGSVTLIPNVAILNQETFADMAGFDNTRDYRGVLSASYMLKSGLQQIQRCRFIIVIQHNNVQQSSRFFRAIERFLNLFGFDDLDENQKQKLLDSTVLVITKAKAYADEYLQNLQKWASELQYIQIERTRIRQQILEVITHILEKKNIFLFNVAELGKQVPICDFFQSMKNTWKYFPLKQIQTIKPVIKIPLNQDFSRLDQQQKNKFELVLNNRMKSYKQLSKLISKFMQKADQNIHQENNYQNQFTKCKQFISKYGVYPLEFNNKLSFINEKQKIKEGIAIPASNGLILANKILELNKLLVSFPVFSQTLNKDKVFNNFKIYMKQAKIHTKNIFLLLRDTFCINCQQQQIILNVLFIALKGYREFQMLIEITKQSEIILNQREVCQNLSFRCEVNQINQIKIKNSISQIGNYQNKVKRIKITAITLSIFALAFIYIGVLGKSSIFLGKQVKIIRQ